MSNDQPRPDLPPPPSEFRLPPRGADPVPPPAPAGPIQYAPAPPAGSSPRKKRRKWPLVVLVILGGLVVAAALGGGNEDEADSSTGAGPAAIDGQSAGSSAAPSQDENTPDPDAPTAGGQLGVGDTDTTSGFEVTLLQVADPWQPTNEFERPSEGKRFVATELNLVNTRTETQTFSTILGLEMIDSLGQRWNVAFAGFDLPSLDGDVPAGTNIRGWAVYEVPADATGLQLVVKGSLTASGVRFHLG